MGGENREKCGKREWLVASGQWSWVNAATYRLTPALARFEPVKPGGLFSANRQGYSLVRQSNY